MKWWLKFVIGVVSVLVILGAAIAGFLALDYNKSAAAAPRVRAAADQFIVADGWTLTTENIKEPGAYCVAVRCPGIQRIWERYDAPKAESVIRMITDSGYLLKLSECLDYSVDEQSPVENGIQNYGCQTTPVRDFRTQVYVSIGRDWNAPPGSAEPEYVYRMVLLVSRVSSTD
ncbi:hypothetical protein AU252_17240 [Pseudarthrobacter sulfonivorans]|uniref:Uncharacterized protein n=1 Tax=Pseudarthrobacter sulfonivorans TaxID=121292 RepID=A0A0U3QME3_9MICC|nr:hypothetical protein [Pseudarthrobacter sulfonivorans]ALV42683.1 hypothetical protein AU252_17240 [Pseudarthrobacter sulfonivorans]